MNISYDSYRVFYYAAKYKSFSQAAAALYSNQPNVTRTIHRLEAELCCSLFSRSPQGVKLTPEGEKLYAHIAAAFLPDVHMVQLPVEITGLDQSKGIPDDHTNQTFHL